MNPVYTYHERSEAWFDHSNRLVIVGRETVNTYTTSRLGVYRLITLYVTSRLCVNYLVCFFLLLLTNYSFLHLLFSNLYV